ncbi:MAG TPA: protease pro-enzyme activation domain-containing protein [Geomonas sp.]|nr:protease pro-enzyme activation domain-containing protein [Geomonas sp.]
MIRMARSSGWGALLGLLTLIVAGCNGGATSTLEASGGTAAASRAAVSTNAAVVRLHGDFPAQAVSRAAYLGRLPSGTMLNLGVVLPLRNQSQLDTLLARLYDPADPMFGRYLTPKEFADSFGPSEADYQAVIDYAQAQGFEITGTHDNRLILNVAATVDQVERAYNLHMHRYQDTDGREFFAPDNDPEVPAAIASLIRGVVGLDNAALRRPHSQFRSAGPAAATGRQIGTGPGGGLTPANITTAYNLSGVSANGSGQVLGLFELDGFNASDISAYTSYFGLTPVPLKTVLVDGYSGATGSGASEVTLDIELMNALAPGASQIIVYEGPNSNLGVIDTYNRIATDNLAKQVSTSWGLSEGQSSSTVLSSENASFQQMAAQGQTIYAASGDSGAYDNGATLSVDDPSSQPYMTGTGGTQLFVGTGMSYQKESSWNVNNTVKGGAGGGGISKVWSIPSWQKGVPGVASTTMRNVPDISLNADQYTGYSIYYQGGWWIFGGTSCASPLWAAFTARVNQQRAAASLTTLGFANPTLYALALGGGYGTAFHDINDGSNNLYYVATTGYDDSTGWGSFNGAGMFPALTQGTPATPAAPTGLTATPGNGSVTLTWVASSGATSYGVYRGTASGAESATPIASGLTATSYTDSGLSNGTTYFYRVTASNSAGTSPPSGEASATPSAVLLGITSGPGATTGKFSAQVTWTTNLSSTSVVSYGTSSGSLTKSVASSTLLTSHALTIPSLSRRTTYFYQVSSAAGGQTVSSGIFSFRTN